MKRILFTLKILFICFFTFAQAPDIQWQKTLGGNQIDDIYSINQTQDGGFVFGCYTSSSVSFDVTQVNHGLADFWIIKTDPTGTIQWQKCIGGIGAERYTRVLQTQDGGYIIGGDSTSNISGDKTENSFGDDDFWVVKLDSLGNVIWDKTYGGTDTETLYSIITTSDGGFLIGGASKSNISGNKNENRVGYPTIVGAFTDYWIIKLDANGNIQWQNTIGGFGDDRLSSMVTTSDGGYFIAGTSISDISGDKSENSRGSIDFWVLKLDSTGTILWQKTIGGNKSDRLSSLISTPDNGFILCGDSNSDLSGEKTSNAYISNYTDFWIIKLNEYGNIIWQKTIGGANSEFLPIICMDTNGNFLIGGESDSNSSFDKTENSRGVGDFWLVKINDVGNIIWDKTIGGNQNEGVRCLTYMNNDNSFIVGGITLSSISGDKTEASRGLNDCWIIKLQPENLATTNFNLINLQIYPNPTTQTVHLDFDERFSVINTKTFNSIGQRIDENKFTNASSLSLNIEGELGVYFIEIENENGDKKTFKIVKK